MADSQDEGVPIIASTEQDGTTAVVKTWLKQAGDRVAENEPIAELETDKVVVEVSAPSAGQLSIVAAEQQDIEPGGLLGYIQPLRESADSEPAQTAQRRSEPSNANADAADNAVGSSQPPPEAFAKEMRLSPSVRQLLRKHDLDPARITGTGRRGRITRADVVAAVETDAQRPAPAPRSVEPSPQAESAVSGSRRVPHSRTRRQIAEHMLRSVSDAPHVTAVFEADFSAIMAHRSAHRADFAEQGVRLTYTAYLVAASVAAMAAAPIVNSRWHEDCSEIFSDVNVGIGTEAGDHGLVVPVVHQAQNLSLLGIASRLQGITERARSGRLTPGDVKGGTFTISNHGTSGSLLATPIIINQPQSAILGVGALEKRVVVREIDGQDTIQIRPMAYVSLSLDHRAIDGAQANAWLRRFVDEINTWSD